MGVTKFDNINAQTASVKLVTSLPTSPLTYYGTSATGDVDSMEWRGGELCFQTGDRRFYMQQATSGTTATWYRMLDQWNTSTSTTSSSSTSTSSSSSTSTTTSTSSSTTTSTTSSSTSSSTSTTTTSTSTSTSSSTSSSTSTSSTTTSSDKRLKINIESL